MPNKIKFSHSYLKLSNQWQGKKATLLFVREIELEKQTKHFIEYDTVYWEDGITKMGRQMVGRYPLPSKGKYLLLLFECEGTIFTTLRSKRNQWIKDKLPYFQERIGQEFELVKVDEKATV